MPRKSKPYNSFRVFVAGIVVGAVGTVAAMVAAPATLRAQLELPVVSSPGVHATPAGQGLESVDVYFSPRGGATSAIVREINSARRQVQVQAYSFTSAPIAKALTDAHARGVDVVAVLDKSQRSERYSSATFLHNHGVAVFIDEKHAIAHNKIILVDDQTIITGSFNFSKAAEERNAENLLVIKDQPALMRVYQKNFRSHLEHAQPYRQ
jgi:phosphatidylserine/phosphatidylglycerophosphate/cardiolipin synthase-like enzyme